MRATLVLLLAGLGGLLYVQWEIAPVAPPHKAQVKGEPQLPAGTPGEEKGFSIPLEDAGAYEVISARPLFSPDRRPPEQAAEPQVSESEAASLEGVDLRTVLITPELSMAWVRDKGGTTDIPLKPGESFRGWTVLSIERNAVTLEYDDQVSTIDLREFPDKAAPAPSIAANGQARRPPAAINNQYRRRPPRRPGKDQ